MAYKNTEYSYNSDIKIENLIDLGDDLDLYSLNINQNKNEIKGVEVEYPIDLLESLNKQCYYLQSSSLESTYDKAIRISDLNEERIILDIKLTNLLTKCDQLKGISDRHKELVSSWLKENLKTYDTIVKQLHRFFDTKKNNSLIDNRDSNELRRLKERENMILDIQRERQLLQKEAEELEVMKRRFEKNEQRVLKKESTLDFIEGEKLGTSVKNKKIFNFEDEQNPLLRLKDTINYIQYERPERPIKKGEKIFNLENEDERNFREGINKNDYKTSTHKNHRDDIASQFS